jgi:hypothetical protein
LETVAAFLQELRDLLCCELRAVIKHDVPVEIPGVVNPVFDLVAFTVQLAKFRTIAFGVAIDATLAAQRQ